MVHFYTMTASEMYTAARAVLGQPTYSWYGSRPGVLGGMEVILPTRINMLREVPSTRTGETIPNLILDVFEKDYDNELLWNTSSARWSMRGWSFQTIADYNEEHGL